ncbi:MAG TPA: selenocysteine-specific translation elongation factor [Candidatus Baltobacteraceae bacterium]|jgi:selenocysteine-specific elongation factor|nr:selenocysteine-specific translation elongation factor [Candidatus Baltobacteraceae bacterium]
MHIIGTAGHVDHGKSALVLALTGTNPDRWAEEQLRGMTLDLGFAHLRFPDGVEAGIIDVPGHERFLHNMLAGAAGMELLLLVIAANEGIMPQTVEHLQILRFLNVRETLTVVTKSDLLTPPELADSISRIRGGLRGTIAESAPMIAVSTRSGENLQQLRDSIGEALRSLPPRELDAPAYLPIDRVFMLPGHGTIVTGTLMQGRISVGDTLQLFASGRAVRVRNLQSFSHDRERVEAGARVAVNVPAVGAKDIARGEVLAAPQFAPSAGFTVAFTPVPEALPLLRRRNPVRAYIGSAEILGTLVLPEVPVGAKEQTAQLFLQRQTVAYPGSAFIVRRLSPKNVLGGGRIAREGTPVDAVRETPEPHAAALVGALRRAGLSASTADELARDANIRIETAQQSLDALTQRGEVLAVGRPPAYVDAGASATLLDRALELLAEAHRAEPWSMGMTSVALSRAAAVQEALLVRILDAYAIDGRIARRAGYFATPHHVPKLSPQQEAFFDEVVPRGHAGALTPVPLAQVAARVKQSQVPGIAKAFDTLLANGVLVKVADHVYRGVQIATIRARVETFLRTNGEMTMAQFRDIIGTSRKYAVPLLEWFDGRGITVRSGDYRKLRNSSAPFGGRPVSSGLP